MHIYSARAFAMVGFSDRWVRGCPGINDTHGVFLSSRGSGSRYSARAFAMVGFSVRWVRGCLGVIIMSSLRLCRAYRALLVRFSNDSRPFSLYILFIFVRFSNGTNGVFLRSRGGAVYNEKGSGIMRKANENNDTYNEKNAWSIPQVEGEWFPTHW